MKGNEDNIYISIYIGKIIFVFFSPAYNRRVCVGGGGIDFGVLQQDDIFRFKASN